ncbi:TPA: hypothetical protein MJC34_21835, partial [Klebsiella pneumoniae]|nr:hypothetical protein [Klebsiella pneumoniae]
MSNRYNTGNPRPSNSMKDLNDNALAYDDFMLSEEGTFVDRLGNEVPTLRGLSEIMRQAGESVVEKIDAQLTEQQEEFETQMTSQQESFESAQTERDTDFSEFLDTRNSAFISQFNQQAQEFDAQLASQESRYESVLQQAGKTVLGRYQDGPWTLTSYNQLVSYGGTFWKLAASVVIGAGYTTAGTTGATWDATDRANFVDVGQDQLRTELGTIFMPAASGDSATDTQLLQAALSVGGQINYNNPGTYYYSSTSTIRSNTRLVIGHGVTWEKDINSVWGPFLRNAAYSNSRYAVTSMTVSTSYSDPWKDNVSSSGLKAYLNIACPGHNFIAGDYVAFYGAVEFGFDGIMKVVSVTDDDNFVVEAHNLPKGTSATYDTWANGLFCFKADENISVEIYGRLDGKCTQLKASGEPSDTMKLYLMGMIFHGIMNGSLYINSIRRMRKYSALIANVRNFVVPFANIDNYSDGLHFMPPYVD